jgi:hypothetical protein
LKDDNESNSDDESVWEGFDDLPERRELDHILILNKTLEDAGRSALQRFNGGIRYDLFINNLGGIDAVRDLILNSIDRDLLDLIENGDLSLKSLKKLKRKNSAMKQKSGIYVHVVYDLGKPDEVQSRKDLGRLSRSGLYTWILSHGYQATTCRSSSREEALEKVCAVWDDLKSLPRDHRATLKDPPAKNYKQNHTIKDIKHPKTRLDLLSMKHKELFAWLKFHDIRTGKGKGASGAS